MFGRSKRNFIFLMFWGAFTSIFIIVTRVNSSHLRIDLFRWLLHWQLFLKLLLILDIIAFSDCKLWNVQAVTIDPWNDMAVVELIKKMEDYKEGLLDWCYDFIFDL